MVQQKKSNVTPKADVLAKESASQRALGRRNFIGMAVAGVMIVLGFLLMLGAPSTTDEFNPDIFSTRRIVVGPLIAFLGFVLMAIAIIVSPSAFRKDKKQHDEPESHDSEENNKL